MFSNVRVAELPRWTALGLVALVIAVTVVRRASPCGERSPGRAPAVPGETCERYLDVGENYPVLVCATRILGPARAPLYICTKDRDLHAPPCEDHVRSHPWFRDPL